MPIRDPNELKQQRHVELMMAKAISDKALAESRETTPDEQRAIEQHMREADKLEIEAAEVIKANDLDKRLQDKLARLKEAPAPRGPAPELGLETPPASRRPIIEPSFRYAGLKAFPRTPDGEELAYRSGIKLAATLFNKAWAQRRCRDYDIETRTMVESDDSAGGVLVPSEMSPTMIDLRETFGIFRQNAAIEPMASDTKDMSVAVSGLTAHFAAELATASLSQAVWKPIKLVAGKCQVMTKVSKELNEDAIINMADMLSLKAAQALAYKEDYCGFNGTGLQDENGIQGIVSKFEANTALKGAVAATSGHDTIAEIDATDLGLVMAALPEYAGVNPRWYVSKVGFAAIFARLLQGAGGNNMQNLQDGWNGPRYLGYPVVISQVLNKTTTAVNDKVMLLFGDLSQAAILGDRRGITMAVADQAYWTTDEIGIKVTERFDINAFGAMDMTDADGSTAVAGPIVALMGNT